MRDTEDKKIKLFYLETDYDITFYSSKDDKKFIVYKTEEAMRALEKLVKSKQFEFKKLI